MSAGHLYHYFESKEAIINGITEAGLADAALRLERMIASSDPMKSLLAEIESAKSTTPSIILPMFDLFAEATRNKSIAVILHRHSRKLLTMMSEFFRKAQALNKMDASLDPDIAAAVVLAIVDGRQIMSVRNPKLSAVGSRKHVHLLITR